MGSSLLGSSIRSFIRGVLIPPHPSSSLSVVPTGSFFWRAAANPGVHAHSGMIEPQSSVVIHQSSFMTYSIPLSPFPLTPTARASADGGCLAASFRVAPGA